MHNAFPLIWLRRKCGGAELTLWPHPDSATGVEVADRRRDVEDRLGGSQWMRRKRSLR